MLIGPDVPVAGKADIIGVDLVGLKDADGIGPDEKAVVVEMDGRLVVVVVEADLRGIARHEEVLPVIVHDEHVLAAIVERVQAAVGVLFELVEEQDVELVAVGKPRPEEADGAVRVAENEAAKVAHERLRTDPRGKEVVIRAGVGELALQEPFLQGKIVAAAGKPVIHVRADDAQFRDGQVIDVENGLQVDSPVRRLEGRVAVRKVHAEPEELRIEELVPVADEVRLEGIRRALEAGRRRGNLPGLEQRFRRKP